MKKTKLGLSVPVAGALVYLVMLFSGYTGGLLAIGYMLLCEEDEDLKRHALTALLVAISVSTVNVLIGLLPEVVDVLRILASLINSHMDASFVSSLTGILYALLSLVKTIVFLTLAMKAYKGRIIRLGFIEELLNR